MTKKEFLIEVEKRIKTIRQRYSGKLTYEDKQHFKNGIKDVIDSWLNVPYIEDLKKEYEFKGIVLASLIYLLMED